MLQGPGWGPSDTYLRRTLLPLLPDGEVLTYAVRNTPGGPACPGPSSQATARLVEDLEARRREWGATRIRIVAHSHGSVVALGYAIRHPERVAALLAFGASVAPVGSTPRSARILREFARDPRRAETLAWQRRYPRAALAAENDRDLARWMRRIAPLGFYDPTLLEQFQRELRDTPPPSVAALRGMPAEPEAWLDDELDAVRARVLLVSGSHDYLTPPDAAERIARRIDGAALLVLGQATTPGSSGPQPRGARAPGSSTIWAEALPRRVSYGLPDACGVPSLTTSSRSGCASS